MRMYKINQKFGRKIQRIRKKELKISQEELASRIGIHRNHMGRIERGETNPPLPLIEKIARALSTPLSKLFD